MDLKLPNVTGQEIDALNDACAICFEPLATAKRLPCGHFFHKSCLLSWLEQHQSCPICRIAIS